MAVVLLAERVVGIEAGAAAAGHPARQEAVAGVAKPGVAAAVVVGTVRIARVHRHRMAAEAVEIVPAEALPWPNAVAAVPSSSRPTAPVRSARASAATAAAYPVVVEDAPWTSVAEEAEGCSPVEIRRTVAAARAAVADDPSVVPESTAAAAAARPFRDASRDAEDDGQTDERSRSSSASAAAPAAARPRTADAVCLLG